MVSPESFEKVVKEAIDELPEAFRNRLENIAIVIEDQPSQDVLDRIGSQSAKTLLGLYQGIPINQRGLQYGNVLPDKISLYQRNIEALSSSKRELMKRIKEVVLHEIGHYFGLSERDLHKIEVKSD